MSTWPPLQGRCIAIGAFYHRLVYRTLKDGLVYQDPGAAA